MTSLPVFRQTFGYSTLTANKNLKKATRSVKKLQSDVMNALASVCCYCLRAELNGWITRRSCYSALQSPLVFFNIFEKTHAQKNSRFEKLKEISAQNSTKR